MKKQVVRNYPQFTHFASIPFIRQSQRKQLSSLQQIIAKIFKNYHLQSTLQPNNPFLFHITLSMLTLPHQSTQKKLIKIINQSIKKQIQIKLSKSFIKLENIKYFTRYNKKINKKQVNVIYIDIQNSQVKENIYKAVDILIKSLMKQQIITQQQLKSMHISYDHKDGLFKPDDLHVTLFRAEGLYQDQTFHKAFTELKQKQKQFKYLFDCDFFDISTRFHYDETRFYQPLFRVQLENKD